MKSHWRYIHKLTKCDVKARIQVILLFQRASLVAQMVKNLPAMQVWCLGQADPLEKKMIAHSSILAWSLKVYLIQIMRLCNWNFLLSSDYKTTWALDLKVSWSSLLASLSHCFRVLVSTRLDQSPAFLFSKSVWTSVPKYLNWRYQLEEEPTFLSQRPQILFPFCYFCHLYSTYVNHFKRLILGDLNKDGHLPCGCWNITR